MSGDPDRVEKLTADLLTSKSDEAWLLAAHRLIDHHASATSPGNFTPDSVVYEEGMWSDVTALLRATAGTKVSDDAREEALASVQVHMQCREAARLQGPAAPYSCTAFVDMSPDTYLSLLRLLASPLASLMDASTAANLLKQTRIRTFKIRYYVWQATVEDLRSAVNHIVDECLELSFSGAGLSEGDGEDDDDDIQSRDSLTMSE